MYGSSVKYSNIPNKSSINFMFLNLMFVIEIGTSCYQVYFNQNNNKLFECAKFMLN